MVASFVWTACFAFTMEHSTVGGDEQATEPVENEHSDADGSDGDDEPALGDLSALFEDWIVDNTETPMVVPQTGTDFTMRFSACAAGGGRAEPRHGTSGGDGGGGVEAVNNNNTHDIELHFRQDPVMRARELPECPQRDRLSETEQVSATGAVTSVSYTHLTLPTKRIV